MQRHSFFAGATLLVAGSMALSACGSSSSSSSGASSSGASSSSAASVSIPGGSSFCNQVASVVAQFSQIGSQLGSALVTSPGVTPNITPFKQLVATVAGVLDQLDSSAPGEIAASFHTLRGAFDQAATQVQSATSLAQISSAFAALSTPAVQAANTAVDGYVKGTCGVGTSTTST
jgi:hypothetical protein